MKKISFLNLIKKTGLFFVIIFIALPFTAECMKRGAEDIEEASSRGASSSLQASSPPHKRSKGEESAGASSSGTSSPISPLIREHRFARATLDVAFKHMLLGDEDREPLISFLRVFTGIDIKSVTHYSTALPILRKGSEEKQTFLDLACKDNKGRYFLIEVQVKEQDYWNPRALYYAAGVYSQQLEEGEPWRKLEPVIALNILDHDRETLPDNHFRRDFQLLDREHLSDLKEGVDMKDPAQLPYLRIIQCELPRANLEIMPNCLLRQWLQLLKESGSLTEIPEGIEAPVRKAYERLEFRKWGSKLIEDYTKEALRLEEYQNVMARKYEAGVLEGKQATARRLLEQDVDVQIISKATGLSLEEIEGLRSKAK